MFVDHVLVGPDNPIVKGKDGIPRERFTPE